MSTGNDIDAYTKSTSRALGAPLVVSRAIFEAMMKQGANTSGLIADGYLTVAAPIDVQHLDPVQAEKSVDGVWRVSDVR